MKTILKNIRYLLLFLGILLYSCEIESAKPQKQKRLVIASDYLKPSDSLLFQNFTKIKGIKVKIIHMSPSKMIGEFRKDKYNTGIDLFMLKSMTNVLNFHKKEILHSLKKDIHFAEKDADYSSEKYNYVGFGYDPFIVALPKSNPKIIRMYNDLTRFKFSTDLSNDELIPMLAPILEKMKRVDANKWVQKFFAASERDSTYNDSIIRNLPILTNYSAFYNSKSNQFTDKVCVFPNTKSTGTFYNLRTFTIAVQAENFTEATTFIKYYSEQNANEILNEKLNTIGIGTNKKGFRKYYYNSEEMMSYYLTVDRLLNKINKD